MKKIIVAIVFVCAFVTARAGLKDSTMAIHDSLVSEKTIREKILSEIKTNLDEKNKRVDSTITTIDDRVGKLDSVIKMTGNPKERIDRIVERVQILEEKQKAIEENELNVYEANYQSAVINLISMDREIKPLILFNTTKDFFNALSETSNPVNYEGFSSGFEKFKVYMDKVKDDDATQKAIADIVQSTGNVSFGIPLVGAYSQLLFTGMANYINSIGHNKRDMKKEAEKMFAITTSLSQFTTDKNLIETEWDAITQSLDEMQVFYDTVLNTNLRMLDISRSDLTGGFTRESDANRRYLYLSAIRERAAEYVLEQKKSNPKEWKANIYYQLMDVQTLKVKYGDITYRIWRHMDKYKTLIAKYKTNKEIGAHVANLDGKLNSLKATFDDAFEPSEYIHAASRMYKVM